MKNKLVLVLFFGFLLTGRLAHADDLSSDLGLFANAKEVFRPLLADPREIQLALRLTTPVGGQNLGDVDIGEYFGLYRWALPWENSYIQWSIAGGIFARFNLVTEQKDSQVIDYSANMPIDIRFGKWSTRLMPYHISSHLGDDYIKRTGVIPSKYTFDSYKQLFAYEPWQPLRLYAGYNYIIRNGDVDLGRYSVQSGTEWTSGWWAHGHAQAFWANDVQSWERIGWNPSLVSQLGVRIAHHSTDKQTFSIFTEFGAGHIAYGQFYKKEETHWVLGVRFDIP